MGSSLGCDCPGSREKVVLVGGPGGDDGNAAVKPSAPVPSYPIGYGAGPSAAESQTAASSDEQFAKAKDAQGEPALDTVLPEPSAQITTDPAIGSSAVPPPDDARGAVGSEPLRTAGDWAEDQEQFAHLPPLPEGWIRVKSRSVDGVVYFCHTATGQTTFTEPTSSEPIADLPHSTELPPGWEEKVSRSTGEVYYWNAALNQSQFVRPTALDAVPEGVDEDIPPGWERVVSRTTNMVYYWNPTLQKSTFEKPTASDEAAQTLDSEGLPSGWVVMESRTTKLPYYYNTVTKESQFERPEA